MARSLSLQPRTAAPLSRLKIWLVGKELYQSGLTSAWLAALAVWLLCLIATPIGLWIFGERLFPLISSLGVIAQLVASLLALAHRWSIIRITQVLLAAGVYTWAVEKFGSTTGFPFGSYSYTPVLQPQLAGVPLLVPLAWVMMLAPAWGAADILLSAKTRKAYSSRISLAAITGLALAAWDLYLDPQMVARGLWSWEQPGIYFGIPLVNFAGWWLTAFVITWLIFPTKLPSKPLLVIYTFTWLFQAVGLGFFWGQPVPALAGFLGMGILSVMAWKKLWST